VKAVEQMVEEMKVEQMVEEMKVEEIMEKKVEEMKVEEIMEIMEMKVEQMVEEMKVDESCSRAAKIQYMVFFWVTNKSLSLTILIAITYNAGDFSIIRSFPWFVVTYV
jgi:hypothetical protein